jgi:hypothetical protein
VKSTRIQNLLAIALVLPGLGGCASRLGEDDPDPFELSLDQVLEMLQKGND